MENRDIHYTVFKVFINSVVPTRHAVRYCAILEEKVWSNLNIISRLIYLQQCATAFAIPVDILPHNVPNITAYYTSDPFVQPSIKIFYFFITCVMVCR